MPQRPVSVVELAGYRRRADELLTVDEQTALIDLIAYEPTCGDLIKGTGGLRKVRVGPQVVSVAARAPSIISTTCAFRFSCSRSMQRMRRPTSALLRKKNSRRS